MQTINKILHYLKAVITNFNVLNYGNQYIPKKTGIVTEKRENGILVAEHF